VNGVKDCAIFMLDAQGFIVSWNEGAQRLKGYTEDEVVGKHFSIFYPPAAINEDHPATELRLAEKDGRYKEEGWRVRKDGSQFLAEVVITALYQDGHLCGFGKVTRDITARHDAEAQILKLNEDLERRVERRTTQLVESERQFRFLAETVPQIIWTATADGSVDYFNQRWFEYTGLTWAQTQSWGWTPVLHADDLVLCLNRWNEALATGCAYEVEYRFKRHDGIWRWHLGRAFPLRDHGGQIVRWVGTCTDIDELKLAQERIRKTNEELEERVNERTAVLRQQADELREAISQVQVLSGLLPICSYCKKIRGDHNDWESLETYISQHSAANFSHGICPECYRLQIVPQFEKMGIEAPSSESK
jgi:PAS domain S-box-containing protein